MKKFLTLLIALPLLGLGCAKQSLKTNYQNSQNNNLSSTSTIEAIANTDITTNTSKWIEGRGNFSQNITFKQPPELIYSGFDADYGRVTELKLASSTYFKMIEKNIFSICPKAECELGEEVNVTPEKYLNVTLDKLKEDKAAITPFQVGSINGWKIVLDGGSSMVAIFNGKIYWVYDERLANNDDKLFLDFLRFFRFQK